MKKIAALLFTLISFNAFAATWKDPNTGITWTYTISNGEVSVGGGSIYSGAIPTSTTGAITIPSELGGYPVTSIGNYAFSDCSGLTSVTIPSSVTSIGERAFSGCRGLTSVTIPEGVTSIGCNAFYNCSGLKEVHISDIAAWCKIDFGINSGDYEANPLYYAHRLYLGDKEVKSLVIPEGVTSIGGYAFYGCSGLTSVMIPSSVTGIGRSAFSHCSKLTSVTIPSSVTSIGSLAFYDCSGLKEVHISDIAAWCKIDFGIDFGNYEANPLYYAHRLYLGDKEVKSLVIPEGVTSVGSCAFYNCSELTSVTIPSSVTGIGRSAFSGCSGLTSVGIPSSVASIGYDAFSGCSGLKEVHISDIAAWCKIDFGNYDANPLYCAPKPLYYANRLYLGDKEATDLVIPDGVTSIGNYAFSGCSGLTSVTIPSSVTSIGNGAFSDCRRLTSVTIPESVTSIGGEAFNETLFYDGQSDGMVILGGGVLYRYKGNCPAIVAIPSGVTSIGDYAFDGCSSLTSVTISEGVTNIGRCAFSYCSGLTSVTIPSSVTSIGNSAFSDCSGLTSVTIPSSVTSIGESAFHGCSGLTSVTIPEGVTSIGDYAFEGCRRLTSVTIPEGVTSIGRDVFYDCSGLTSVTIPEGVTSIGVGAFSNCRGLTSVTIPEGVTSIGGSAFYGCSGLTSVMIPSSVKSIVSRAFSSCSGLTSVTIPEGVTNIGDYAFEGCLRITSVTIPEGVTSIGRDAFSKCRGLTSVTIPSSVTSIVGGAFSSCGGLKEVHISDIAAWCKIDFGNYDANPLYYAHGLYLGDKEVVNLVIPEGVANIGDYTFYNCSGLTSVTIPSSVTNIGDYAFCNCSGLTTVTIPEGVTSIVSCAFVGCSGLMSINVNLENEYYCSADGVLYNKDVTVLMCCPGGLTSITIPSSVTSIYERAFDGCSGLTSITISEGVTSIDNGTFYGCSGLTSVTIPSSVTSIGEYAFYNCSGLTSVTIPEGVTSIGGYAFYGCSGLTSVMIPSSVTSIGSDVFAYCHGLKSVYVDRGDVDRVKSLMRGKGADVDSLIFIEPCVVAFNANGGSCDISSRQVAYQSAIGEMPVPSKGGYNFAGWFTEKDGGEEITPETIIESDVTYYAHWTPINYSISYLNLRGMNNPNPSTYTILDAITFLPLSEKSGLRFVGWDKPSIALGSIGDITVTASWEECELQDIVDIPTDSISFGGDADWLLVYVDGKWTMRSGRIAKSQSSYCDIKFTGPAKVSFSLKVSCEAQDGEDMTDGMELLVDGESVLYISGITNWEDKYIDVLGEGEHTVRWYYSKDNKTDEGDDCCYVSDVVVTPIYNIAFIDGGADGGEAPIALNVWKDGEYELPDCGTLYKTKYAFVGWKLGEVVYPVGTKLTATESVEFIAVWEAKVLPMPIVEVAEYYTTEKTTVTIDYGVDGVTGYYKLDGGEPIIYEGPFEIEGAHTIVAYAIHEDYFDSAVTKEYNSVRAPWTIGECLNYDGVFGDTTWVRDLEVTHDGKAAMRSGITANKESSQLTMTINGSARVSFWIKTSSEYDADDGEVYDGFVCYIDGVAQNEKLIGGEIDWQELSFDVVGAGEHTLTLSYEKDKSGSGGEDCVWVDEVKIASVHDILFKCEDMDMGEPPQSLARRSGEKFELPNCGTLKKMKYAFAGWKLGGVIYTPGTVFTVIEPMEFTAVWEAKLLPMPIVEVAEYYTTETTTVTINYGVDGVTGYYKLDGGEPIVYDGPFEIKGTHTIVAYAIHEDYFDSAITKEYRSVRAPWTIGECLNYDGTFGDTTWVRDLEVTHDGKAAMRSGITGNKESSQLTLSVSGSGMLTFWCKTSSEYDIDDGTVYDGMVVYVDGVAQNSDLIGGDTSWTRYDFEVVGEGEHTIVWSYEKDKGGTDGEDCIWLDEVVWERKTAGGAVIGDVTALKEVFGAESSVVRNLTSEEELMKFNEFLGKCGIATASQISEKQKRYAYESFRMSAIMVEPQLCEDEPKLKIHEFKQGEGGWSVSISLKAGGEEIAMARKALEERIRVGNKLTDITSKPNIVTSPSEDGASLTFTIAPPEGHEAFVRVR